MGVNQAKAQYYLEGHWDFTNAYTIATDLSGKGHDGTVIGATPATIDGRLAIKQKLEVSKDNGTVHISTNSLSPGTYYIEVQMGTLTKRQKFSKL
ncbi:MAG: hypothetical protein ABI169_06280 [Chitinophagaceae bacterium]